jgi:hypothetical protein
MKHQLNIFTGMLLLALAVYLFILISLFKDSPFIKNLTGVFLLLTVSGFIKERLKKAK